MEQSASEDTTRISLSDLLPELVENICSNFIFDGKSLLRLVAVNKFWRRVLSDPKLWNRLCTARFGPDATITLEPAQPATAIPGWCFFAGLDSNGNDCARLESTHGKLRPRDIAARAERLDAIAFNTEGWIKNELLPKFRWNRYSYIPGVGLYVKEEAVVRTLGSPLPPPLLETAEPQGRPPDFPGWVFYHMLESSGGEIRHPANGDLDFTSSCSTLEELEEVASRTPNCVAFNTKGCLKMQLRPQVHWQQVKDTCSWCGMYVREDVVEASGLCRPERGPLDSWLRYFQLGKTTLLAAWDVDVVWLNGSYLLRIPDPAARPMAAAAARAAAAPAASSPVPEGQGAGEVVKLSHVCWLDLSGRFHGVGPGKYLCKWILSVDRDFEVSNLELKISTCGARRLGSGLAASTDIGRKAVTSGTSGGDDSVDADSESAMGLELSEKRVTLKELREHAGAGWYEQDVGCFEVPAGIVYDVEVRLWNHDADWKRGLMFKELKLVPLYGKEGKR